MPAKNDFKVVGSSGKTGGSAKWVTLGVITLAVVIAVQAGWAGFGWAQLKSALFPGDEGLLAYVPEDAGGVLLVDPHQIEPSALGSESGAVRQTLSRTRDDMKKATGVDLFFDVDKLALAPSVAVVRGRFDADALEKRLGEMGYKPAEHKGQRLLVRAGEDAVAIVSGSLVLYGSAESIGESLDAKESGKSLEKKEGVVERLKAVGFDHPVLFTMGLSDARPSVRDILMGSTGPRAVTVGLRTVNGLDVDAAVDSQSASSAEELRKLLDEKRGNAGALAPVLGGDAGAVIADTLKKAELRAQGAQVIGHAHVNAAELDTLMRAANRLAPTGEAYKNLRLFQLLVPNL